MILFLDNTDQYGSEIAVHPTKNFLYVSNRGHGPLIMYEIKVRGLQRKQVIFFLFMSTKVHFFKERTSQNQ